MAARTVFRRLAPTTFVQYTAAADGPPLFVNDAGPRIDMDTKQICAEIRALAGTGRKVRLSRARPSEPRMSGFIVAASPELVVLEVFHDFHPEGYAVVRTGDVTEVRSGEYEWHWERMFRAEGIVVQGAIQPALPLEDLPALLTALARREENIIVVCEDAEERLKDFYIGRLLQVGPARVAFANFNALGRWDPDVSEILMDEITQVGFRTPYLQIFSRHLEGPCPHL